MEEVKCTKKKKKKGKKKGKNIIYIFCTYEKKTNRAKQSHLLINCAAFATTIAITVRDDMYQNNSHQSMMSYQYSSFLHH